VNGFTAWSTTANAAVSNTHTNMNSIQQYEQAKYNLRSFLEWRRLIGLPHIGGGGGIGAVTKVNCSMTIYFQERDGSNNYHESPCQETMCKAAHTVSLQIIDKTEALLRDELKLAAKSVSKICKDIIKEAEGDPQ